MKNKAIISCVVPLNRSNTELVVGLNDSGAELLVKRLPGCAFVAVFQTTPSEIFENVFNCRDRDTAEKPSVLFCCNDQEGRWIAAYPDRSFMFFCPG